MAEKGVECVREHQEGIRNCIVSKVPEIEANVDNPDSLDINELIINEEQCRCGLLLSWQPLFMPPNTKVLTA